VLEADWAKFGLNSYLGHVDSSLLLKPHGGALIIILSQQKVYVISVKSAAFAHFAHSIEDPFKVCAMERPVAS
jgi:hypothetical protein